MLARPRERIITPLEKLHRMRRTQRITLTRSVTFLRRSQLLRGSVPFFVHHHHDIIMTFFYFTRKAPLLYLGGWERGILSKLS